MSIVLFGACAAPDATSSPSPAPTAAPSFVVTSAPSPSSASVAPSSPSAAPTASPTAAPTASPTAAPTASPTAAPTDAPAAAPVLVAVNCSVCWPLTGRPVAGGDVTRRPLVVKIDNAPLARPHRGITRADVVFETLVEGFVTRLAAVFQSQDPEVVASVRSARLTDLSLAPMVRGALAYSGASDYEIPLLAADERRGRFIYVGATRLGLYYRLPDKPAPNNLAARTADLRAALARIDPTPVAVPPWSFVAGIHEPAAGGLAAATAAAELTIPYRTDRVLVTYRYDAASRTYARWQNQDALGAVRTVDAEDGRPVAAANVVIVRTEVREVPQIVDAGGFVSYDSRLTGGGPVTIFRDGLRQEGRWERVDDFAAFRFVTAAGAPILLAPGQTWVHVIPSDWAVTSR